jgi:hypothetical protein
VRAVFKRVAPFDLEGAASSEANGGQLTEEWDLLSKYGVCMGALTHSKDSSILALFVSSRLNMLYNIIYIESTPAGSRRIWAGASKVTLYSDRLGIEPSPSFVREPPAATAL